MLCWAYLGAETKWLGWAGGLTVHKMHLGQTVMRHLKVTAHRASISGAVVSSWGPAHLKGGTEREGQAGDRCISPRQLVLSQQNNDNNR